MVISISPHRTILGTRIDATSYEDACDRIQTWIEQNHSAYIVAANVHVVMTGYWRKRYQRTINQAKLITPDGMPLVWGNALFRDTPTTSGLRADLMLAWCERAATKGIPVFLYGGTENTLQKLKRNLQQKYPDLMIVGTHAPPFRQLTQAEEESDRRLIESSGAKVVLVGLGCPKQEEWMFRQREHLPVVMIGVGAAFRFHSGEVSQSPRWMMDLGLEWLYRLLTEPRRLWQRYLINNPSFLVLFGWQLLQERLKG